MLKHLRYDSLAAVLVAEIDAKVDAFVDGAELLEHPPDVFHGDVSVETADPDAEGRCRSHC
jgi:hypothetical protein